MGTKSLGCALLIALALSLPSFSRASALAPRGPILIDGNADFTPVNGVVSGSGTENDPYIIEGWEIDASSAHGVEIRNTTAHFIVRNCYVRRGRSGKHSGIHLSNVRNGRISNVTSGNNFYGIYLGSSSNNLIENCTVENNSYGVYLTSSPNNTFRGNSLSKNWRNFSIIDIKISNFYQDIDTSNEIDGKPIYYVVERENLVFDGNAMDIGYLALVSCRNIQVRNLHLNNNSHGVLLAGTSRSTVKNCRFENNSYGVQLHSSTNNLIENCATLNGTHGVYLYFSSNQNIIRNCTISRNSSYGIILYYSSENNIVYHNRILNNVNQARDDCTNRWDDGYPSGGNYWSDYAGADEYQGEDQDVPGSDGIGDTPYNIPGGASQDRYPLMEEAITEVEIGGLAISPELVEAGEAVSISVMVRNLSDSGGTFKVILLINGAVESTKEVTLAGGETRSIAFTVTKQAEGTYSVEVDGLAGTFKVTKAQPTTQLPFILGVIIAVIMMGSIALVLYKRKRTS